MSGHDYDDNPITNPEQDRLGVDPFAHAIAQSIRHMKAPEGSVIAINGPWGSGKSSAVNLVTHHLGDARAAGKIEFVKFSCWWFRGEEALATAFFNELGAVLGGTIHQAQKLLSRLRNRVLQTAPLIGTIANVFGPGSGPWAKAVTDTVARLTTGLETVEQLHAQLHEALAKSDKRFLVVIDDIDRLSPEEALQMFRLVKSVGQLPNVIYLIAYDRELAERLVQVRFPSEGPHYLEKIVQAVFELPAPRVPDLHAIFIENIEQICNPQLNQEETHHFHNVFVEVIGPEIKMPRDVVRLANAVSVTWPAVAGEVDLGDFLAIEALRVFQPGLYRAIRQNRGRLCQLRDSRLARNREQEADEADHALLNNVKKEKRQHYREVLKRLFPAMEDVWSNKSYGPEFADLWARRRRVSSGRHFDTYFRLSIGDDTLPAALVRELIERADDEEFAKQAFCEALAMKRSNGSTNAALLLEELTLYSEEFGVEKIELFLVILFKLGDQLNIPEDKGRGVLQIADNHRRMHWLLRKLTFDRFSLDERSPIFVRACQGAALGWLINFTMSAYGNHFPRSEEASQIGEDRWLVNRSALDELVMLALSRLRAAAEDGSLRECRDLAPALFAWYEFTNDEGQEVQKVTAKIIADDDGVACLARAFTSEVWTETLGDAVARREFKAQISNLSCIMDVEKFRSRLEELENRTDLSPEDKYAISNFLASWRRQERNENNL